jgi:hypothetical protein
VHHLRDEQWARPVSGRSATETWSHLIAKTKKKELNTAVKLRRTTPVQDAVGLYTREEKETHINILVKNLNGRNL